MDTKPNIEVKIINAFVDHDKGGNPAGVVFDAGNLTTAQKQQVAQKAGLSETAFVSGSATADVKLEFFTPTRQIAHCGHATIATFSYLSQQGLIRTAHSSKETIDGNREILIQGDLAFMEQKAPCYTCIEHEKATIVSSLGLTVHDLLPGAPIHIVNTGNAFAIIPVAGREVLERIQPDFDVINQVSETYDLVGFYVCSTSANIPGRDATTRMFAPRYGIAEEAATGMAAGPLAGYLYDNLGIKKDRFIIEQGWFMQQPSPSVIMVDLLLCNNTITKIMAGGKGIQRETLIIEICM